MGKAKDAYQKAHPRPCGAVRVLYFTDCHDRLDLDKTRFHWLGMLVQDTKPDYLVCGGDMMDVDSLNSHDRNETLAGKLKPAFARELQSLNEVLAIIKEYAPNVPKHITLGNHEDRIRRWENQNPEAVGILVDAFYGLLKGYGWHVTEFKQYLNIMGVEFTHAPVNAMGKEIGGKLAASNIATNSIADIVYGHTHKMDDFVAAKLGPDNRKVRAYNGGVFLPDGYRMAYAKASANSWDYGCSILTIRNGKIDSREFITMLELEARYGKKAANKALAGPKV